MAKQFIGSSKQNDIQEALEDAIARAKTAMTTDFVTWEIDFIKGEAGGFVLARDLHVGILAEPPSVLPGKGPAFFTMEDASKKPFVLKLISSDQIEHARRILDGSETSRVHVQGTIVKSTAPYNPHWSYHLDPASIDFFEFAIEVCDSASAYVEENLGDVGGAFLPDNHWCPWSSKLLSELPWTEVEALAKQ